MKLKNLEALKKKFGIEKANCETCTHYHVETDGDDGGNSWVCGEECTNTERKNHEQIGNLKSFPFKKEQPKCWYPEYLFTNRHILINKTTGCDGKCFKSYQRVLKKHEVK